MKTTKTKSARKGFVLNRNCTVRGYADIALQFPERIAMIREWEQKMEREYGRCSTFFRPNVCPPRYHDREYVCEDGSKITVATVDAVVKWALTGYRCKGTWETNPEPEAKGCNSGFCE